MMWLAVIRNLYVRRKIEEPALDSAITNHLITADQKAEIMASERVAEDA